MKTTKEQINKIKELKKKGKTMVEISKELNLPYSTVQYYFNSKYKENQLKRSKEYVKKHGITRNEKNYKEYQRNYHAKKYNEDPDYREKLKKLNRENQRK